MKKVLFSLTFLISINCFAAPLWESAIVNSENDCVVISSATDKAPIDFYKAECKSFAGFRFFIEGGDIRYSPSIYFGNEKIDLHRPSQFHDMASNNIEWLYTHDIDVEGSGEIIWKGIIYQLAIADEDENGHDKDVFFSVRLDEKKFSSILTIRGDP